MQQLHLVGFTTDHRGLIFSVRRGARSGSYVVDVGEELFAAIDEARARLDEVAGGGDDDEGAADAQARGHTEERPQSTLSVREVQARLRQGRSIEAVAREAGVDVAWVERFAAPVLTERAEVIRSVRARRFTKQRVGTSGAPLGESVYRNLVERGVSAPRDELDRGWTARQLPDGEWEVGFAYVSRGRRLHAAWAFDQATGKVTARDRLAGQLAFRPGGPPAPSRAKGASAGAAAVAEAAAADEPRPTESATAAQAARGAKATKASARRVASARKAARARMAADAQKATKRNAAMARKAATRKPKKAAAPTRASRSPEAAEPGRAATDGAEAEQAADAMAPVADVLEAVVVEADVAVVDVAAVDDAAALDEAVVDAAVVEAQAGAASSLLGQAALPDDDPALDLAWDDRDVEAGPEARGVHDGASRDEWVIEEEWVVEDERGLEDEWVGKPARPAAEVAPAPAPRRGPPRPPRREPLRARPAEAAAPDRAASASSHVRLVAATTPGGVDGPRRQLRVRREPLDLGALGTAGTAPPPVFRRDLARPAAEPDRGATRERPSDAEADQPVAPRPRRRGR